MLYCSIAYLHTISYNFLKNDKRACKYDNIMQCLLAHNAPKMNVLTNECAKIFAEKWFRQISTHEKIRFVAFFMMTDENMLWKWIHICKNYDLWLMQLWVCCTASGILKQTFTLSYQFWSIFTSTTSWDIVFSITRKRWEYYFNNNLCQNSFKLVGYLCYFCFNRWQNPKQNIQFSSFNSTLIR